MNYGFCCFYLTCCKSSIAFYTQLIRHRITYIQPQKYNLKKFYLTYYMLQQARKKIIYNISYDNWFSSTFERSTVPVIFTFHPSQIHTSNTPGNFASIGTVIIACSVAVVPLSVTIVVAVNQRHIYNMWYPGHISQMTRCAKCCQVEQVCGSHNSCSALCSDALICPNADTHISSYNRYKYTQYKYARYKYTRYKCTR